MKEECAVDPELYLVSKQQYEQLMRAADEKREPTDLMKAAFERYKRDVTSR